MEEEDSSPHNSLTWSPVQRPPTGRLNMNYCLLIQVTLTDELGEVPPPLHTWMTPVIEDMLREARAGLTEAVVIGPGKAVLFYGRCSLGEGLKADEARDATFLLTGAGTWVGRLAYLTTDPMTLQEGKRAMACTVLDQGVKARGLGHPQVNLHKLNHLSGLTLQGLLHLENGLHVRFPKIDRPLVSLLKAKAQQEEERPKTTIT